MKKNIKINPHAVIWIVIAILLFISVVRLVIWNIGTQSNFDPDNITDDFTTEALDTIYRVDRSKIEGFVDDNITTVLMVGNNPLESSSSPFGIASIVAEKSDAQVQTAAFPNTCLAAKNSVYSEEYSLDAFSLYYLTKAMCDGDYSLQDNALSNGSVSADYSAPLDVLKNADYANVDVLVFTYDANDYIQTRNLYDPENPSNSGTYEGALRASATQIQEKYPHIRIIFMSPYFASAVANDGTYLSGDVTDFGCGTIPDYLLYSINVGNDCMFTVIDNYYGSIYEDIAGDYLIDNIHLNEKGTELLGNRLAEVIGLAK